MKNGKFLHRDTCQYGFTLIELIVVLAIVAILALFAIPDKTSELSRVYIKQSLNLIGDYQQDVIFYYRAIGEFPDNNDSLDFTPAADQIKGNYFTELKVDEGALHMRLGNKIQESLQGKYLSLRPIYVPDSPTSPISWICGYDTVPDGMEAAGDNKTDIDPRHLPMECR